VIVAILVVLLILAAFLGIGVLVVSSQESSKKRERQAVTVSRPGWHSNAGGPMLRRRYHLEHPYDAKDCSFESLLWGELPGGAKAETFHVVRYSGKGGRGQVSTYYTVATVVFPRPLPSVSLRETHHPSDLQPVPMGPNQDFTYNEGRFGALWAGLRGFATDPNAAAVLFSPEMLARTRALRADWRMNGYAAIAVVRDRLPPPAMLVLVDNLASFGAMLPEEVWQAAAGQPDPWPGPTEQRPA
jgi:hypothetical protein